MDNKEYKEFADRKMPDSPLLKDTCFAFLIGGAICTFGQFLNKLYTPLGMGKEMTSAAVSVTLVFLGILLTALNIYHKIAKFAGAGTIVPITGFANAVSSAAIEAKSEGLVMGVGAKLFTIAGPVIVYGISASFVAGLWYWLF